MADLQKGHSILHVRSHFWAILLHKSITESTYRHDRVHLVKNSVGLRKQKTFRMSNLSFSHSGQADAGELSSQWQPFDEDERSWQKLKS